LDCQIDLLNHVTGWFREGIPKRNHRFRSDALEIVAGAKRRLADDGCQVGAVRDPTGFFFELMLSRGVDR
jgi:hypothetical protein